MKIKILIVILLAVISTIATIERFKVSTGVDFYQYWGVGKAQKWSFGTLKSPSAAQEQYAEVLNYHAARSSDARLRRVSELRHKLELLQTPLCYSLFTPFPTNYSLAFGIFQIIQIILFLSAIVMLSAVHYGNWLRLLSLALLLLIFYRSLASDLNVGNLNCVQLFGFASLLVLADRFLTQRSTRSVIGPSIAFMAILVFLTLLKPNMILVTFLLAGYLWLTQGMAVFARAASAGVAFGAVLMSLPCIQFDSWTVWQDWYSYFRTWDSASLLAFIPRQNLSPLLLVSQILGSSVLSAVILLAALLIASMLIALIMAVPKEESLIKGMLRAAIRAISNPHLITATGITAALILSPLVWYHYYTLSLLPALWLLSPRHPWSQAGKAGWLSIILTSKLIPGVVNRCFGWNGKFSYGIVTLGLVPLWAGVLAAIAPKEKSFPKEGASPNRAKINKT